MGESAFPEGDVSATENALPTGEAAEVLESHLQGKVGDKDVAVYRNPSEYVSEVEDTYPTVAEAVACPPVYMEISEEEVPAATEDQGTWTFPSYYLAPTPELMDSPMPENISAPAVAAMIRLMGAAPHTPEIPDVHSLLQGQKRNEALIISLQYGAREEARADHEGYESIIDDLLMSSGRCRCKGQFPFFPHQEKALMDLERTNGPLILFPLVPGGRHPTRF